MHVLEIEAPFAQTVSVGVTGDAGFDREFRARFTEHFAWVFRYVDRLTGDEAVAADITQEVFVRLHRRGAVPDDIRAWLATVAHNLIRDDRRRQARHKRLLAERAPEDLLADATPATDARLLSDERRRLVRATLDDMTDRDRQLLLLRQEGLSYRELALVLSIEASSVGTLLARARAAFRRVFLRGSHVP